MFLFNFLGESIRLRIDQIDKGPNGRKIMCTIQKHHISSWLKIWHLMELIFIWNTEMSVMIVYHLLAATYKSQRWVHRLIPIRKTNLYDLGFWERNVTLQ